MHFKFVGRWLRLIVQKYDHETYWKMREYVVDSKNRSLKLKKYYYLYRIKKMDAFANASMATNIGRGAKFDSPPILPHNLYGIFISYDAHIGKNCTIFPQVTINGKTMIGDNCFIGIGAKIIGNVKIGNNVKIGANAVVTKDIPDNSVAVGVPAKVIRINSKRVDGFTRKI